MKKMLIRILALTLCFLFLLPIVACGDKDPDTEKSSPSDSEKPSEPGTSQEPASSEAEPASSEESPSESEPEDTRQVVGQAELLQKLTSSPYSDNIRTETSLGLSDPSVVGIDESKINDVLYPVPADSEFAADHIYVVTDYGISTTSEENSKKFNNLMKSLQEVEGPKKVVFPAGVYPFLTTLKIENVNDCYICSDNPNQNFEIRMVSWCAGIDVRNCSNLHFNNYDFDYEIPTTVTGKVVSSSINGSNQLQVVIKINDEFDLNHKNYNGGKVNWGSYMEYTYDEATQRYYPDIHGNLLYNSTGDQIKNMADGVYNATNHQLTMTFKAGAGKEVAKDTVVSICYTMYEYFGFHASDCQNIYMESINLYHTAGMAVGMSNVTNIYVNRLHLALREGSTRLVTATADGFHTGDSHGEMILTNCVFESSHDDCMNIKNSYQKVLSAMPKQVNYDASSATLNVEVGDVIEIYDNSTLRFVGAYTVTKVDTTKKAYTVKERIEEFETLQNFLICLPSKAASLTIRNCFFGHKRNRGMLIQTRNVEISSCTFQNLIMGPIMIFSVIDIFGEGIMPGTAYVKNNKFLNCNGSDIYVFARGKGGGAVGTIKDIHVENNFFYLSHGTPVALANASNSSVTNNLIYNAQVSRGINVWEVDSVSIKDNCSIGGRDGFNLLDIEDSAQNVTENNNQQKAE